ncbi:MAG TPA: alpha-amylase C-terminal beta-sheet domain-containing protein [Gemmataceae bacterium]|nr:alpha-amylase C-terminal beta-sheet domain-containing protein [Gemmataceae bacterium]
MRTESRHPWIAVVTLPRKEGPPPEPRYHGDGHEILLQGFHWDSHAGGFDPATGGRKSWYRILAENAAAIKEAGFSWVWFPPPSDSLAPQGYIPRRWNVLDTAYGTEAELRAAIRALEPVKALADVVLNHRVGVATAGADFEDPPFPDNRAAVTRDDDSGIGTGNPDTGEHYAAGRELDHTNPDVRATVKNYLRRLRSVGFRGWRYDLVKGYHGRFVAEYNEASAPEFSVGEFFDTDRQRVTDWIDATGGKSTAFDFPTRYLLYEACLHDDYGRLRSVNGGRVVPGGLIGFWSSRAVTFVDNHDTEYRRDEEHRRHNDATRHFPGRTVEVAYAYVLTHPGIPCVFWSHYFDWGSATRQRIDRLIRVRRGMGLHAQSQVEIKDARKGLYAAIIDGRVAVKLGSCGWWPGGGWQLAVDGEKFAVWTRCH